MGDAPHDPYSILTTRRTRKRAHEVRPLYAASTPITRRFLNRVRMFDSCRGHLVPPASYRSDRPSEARSTFVAMSSGRLPTRPLVPEDDWFVEANAGRPAVDDVAGLRETRQPAQGPGEPLPAVGAREDEPSREFLVRAIAG